MSRNHQSFYERVERDLARLDRLKSSDRGVLESLLFYLLGYIEGFREAGAISGKRGQIYFLSYPAFEPLWFRLASS